MKKNKKGFTLVEVIIAMAIFAIMSLLVCTLYAFLGRMVITSNTLNTKVDSQVANYEKETSPDVATTPKQIIFGAGTLYEATVDIDVNVIEGNTVDTNANPNIQYFKKK